MTFQVGDQVVHSVYGLGTVSRIEEKLLQEKIVQYYVVLVNNLTIYVPVDPEGDINLRYPTPAKEFSNLFTILRGPAEPLSNDRLIRRTQLANLIKDGKLESICKAIRDLSFHKQTFKLNEYDLAFMNRVQNNLLNEWASSLSISISQAKSDLSRILLEGKAPEAN